MNLKEFEKEYDIDSAVRIRPTGQLFDMYVTPRYVNHYENQDLPYKAYTTALLTSILSSSDMFLDIGSHYGFFSLVAASKYDQLKIISVEPTPESFLLLLKNVAFNKYKNIVTLNKAVSDQTGTSLFNISLSSDNCSFYPHPNAQPLHRIEVPTTSVDHMLSEVNVRSLSVKIDTDGHEIAVLDGMSKALERIQDVKLIVEFNPKMQEIAGHSPEELFRVLARKGFEVFLLDDLRRIHYRITPNTDWTSLMNTEGYSNLYCVRGNPCLNVCFVSHSANKGGAEFSLLELVREFISIHGALCTVILPGDGPLDSLLRNVGASTIICNYDWWCCGKNADQQMIESRLTQSIKYLSSTVLGILTKIDPDFIFTQTLVIPWGAILASLIDKPHVWSVCEYGELDHDLRFLLPFEDVIHEIMSSSNFVFALPGPVSMFTEKMDSSKLDTLYRYIPMPVSKLTDINKHAAGIMRGIKIGIFANIHKGKGQEDAILALNDLKACGYNVQLILAGQQEVEYTEYLKTLIVTLQLSDSVHFTGFVDNVHELMNEMDILVSCSCFEAFGRAIVEGMLIGKATIYARSGGPAQYMEDGHSGLGYEPGDYKELSEKLKLLIDNPEKRINLGNQAKQFASEKFTAAEYGGKVFKKLNELKIDGATGNNFPRSMLPALKNALSEMGRDEFGTAGHSVEGHSQLFIDSGNDFNESESIRILETTERSSLNFNLPPDRPIKALRFDPLDGPCVVKIGEPKLITLSGKIVPVSLGENNAELVVRDKYYFSTNDPIIHLDFEITDEPLVSLEITINYIATGYEALLQTIEAWQKVANIVRKQKESVHCDLGQRDQELEEFAQIITTKDEENEQLRAAIEELTSQIKEQSDEFTQIIEEKQEQNRQLVESGHVLAKKIQEQSDTIKEIYNSTSWRLTKPLRILGKQINHMD